MTGSLVELADRAKPPGPAELTPEAAAFVLLAAERAVDSLPVDAFHHDGLYIRAQSLAEALEAGIAAVGRVDRPGQGNSRLT